MPYLLKFLSYEKDFTLVAEEILKECAASAGMKEICLVQADDDPDKSAVVALCDKTGFWKAADGYIALSDYISSEKGMCVSTLDDGSDVICIPVYLNQKAAMYVCAHALSGYEDDAVKTITQAALVIQSVASHRIFADSLEDSYKLLGNVLDCVPAGVAVLDCENRNVLLMNRTLEKSETMQSIIGKVLSAQNITEDTSIKDMPDDKSGRWFDLDFIYIKWIQGEQVLMCSVLDVTERVKDRERAEYQANNDYLTGLYNRLRFERDIKAELDGIGDNNKGALIYLDLDDFKQINDTLGHQYGDVLLQNIATALMQIEPISDSCYRLGGDEFVIIIKPEYYAEMQDITGRIREIFEHKWDLMGTGYYCTMSMGAAVYPDEGAYVKEIMHNADYAMYRAKKTGKNRFFMYSECMDESTHGRTYMVQELSEAIEAGYRGFSVDYNTCVSVKGGKYRFATVRYKDLSGNVIKDSVIAELAEYRGLDAAINEYVMEQVLMEASAANEKNTGYLISLTGAQIASDQFMSEFERKVRAYAIEPSKLVLSLSCRHKFRDSNKAASSAARLKQIGYTIAISDFEEGDMALRDICKYSAGLVTVHRKDTEDDKSCNGIIAALEAFRSAYDFDICIL